MPVGPSQDGCATNAGSPEARPSVRSSGYGDFWGVALAVAAEEGVALCCSVTPVPRSEGFAVPERETFALALADALAAGVLPGEPVAGAGDAAGATVGIAINSRCKLVSLALRLA
jgi:hypothetical protein